MPETVVSETPPQRRPRRALALAVSGCGFFTEPDHRPVPGPSPAVAVPPSATARRPVSASTPAVSTGPWDCGR
ncbi:hypothetical protein ACFQ51_33090 [Streptomyces kaempferi]